MNKNSFKKGWQNDKCGDARQCWCFIGYSGCFEDAGVVSLLYGSFVGSIDGNAA
jgi:hypothetical protein